MSLRRHRGRIAYTFAASLAVVSAAEAATVHFDGGTDDIDNVWSNPAYWTPAPPGSGDDAIIDYSLLGVVIEDGDDFTVNSLELNGGINIHTGGRLTVIDQIINNGPNSAYAVNAGVLNVGSGGTLGTIINTYDDLGDDDSESYRAGYWHNSGQVSAHLDNSGAAINGGDEFDPALIVWTGDVENREKGFVSNSGGTWEGDLTNEGGIVNSARSIWIGDVTSIAGHIENEGLWRGDVLSNTGAIFSNGIWEGNINNSESIWLSGEVRGSIANTGRVHVLGQLSSITSMVNNGDLDMLDGTTDDSITVQSWSGTGTASLDFAPAEGRSDRIMVSGDYSGSTTIVLVPTGQARGLDVDIPVVVVGGARSGDVALADMPDGVISYRLVEAPGGWNIRAVLGDAPANVASTLTLVGRSTAALIEPATDGLCAESGWAKPVGGANGGESAGRTWRVDASGIEIGGQIGCAALPGGGIIIDTAFSGGFMGGRLSYDSLEGQFAQGFAALTASLDAGPLAAILQGRVTGSSFIFDDPAAGLDRAAVTSVGYDLSASAGYDLELDGLTLTPVTGLELAGIVSATGPFGDVGGANLSGTPSLAAHIGLTASGRLPAGETDFVLAPFASVMLHGELVAPGASFAPDAGGVASLDVPGQGTYVALGVGLDLLGTEASEGAMAGVRADLDYGPLLTRSALSGYARMSF